MDYVNSSIGTISVLRSVVSPNQYPNMTTEPANWRLGCSQQTRSLALDFAKKGKYNIDVHLHSNRLFGKGVVCADIAWSTHFTRVHNTPPAHASNTCTFSFDASSR